MQRFHTKQNDVAVSVMAAFDGRAVLVSLEFHPLSASLSVSPNEARTLAAMLSEQAEKCSQAEADAQRLRDIALESAMAADDRRAA